MRTVWTRHRKRCTAKFPTLSHVALGGHTWIACTSCKYFSRANPSRSEGARAALLDRVAGAHSEHQSRLTYDGHIAYVRKYHPHIVFSENTDLIADVLPLC